MAEPKKDVMPADGTPQDGTPQDGTLAEVQESAAEMEPGTDCEQDVAAEQETADAEEAAGENEPAEPADADAADREQEEDPPAMPAREAPAQAVRDFDDLVREAKDLQEMSSSRGWKLFYGEMLSARSVAKDALLIVDKTSELKYHQATVSLVNKLINRLKEPIDRLNELRSKHPLFEDEFCYTAELDEITGRIDLEYHAPKQRVPADRNSTANVTEQADPPGGGDAAEQDHADASAGAGADLDESHVDAAPAEEGDTATPAGGGDHEDVAEAGADAGDLEEAGEKPATDPFS